MNPDRALSFPAAPAAAREPGLLERLARRALRERLAGLEGGVIELRDAHGVERFGRANEAPSFAADPLAASLTVRDPSFWAATAFRGTVGAGESYAVGAWECDDLASLVRILLRDESTLRSLDSGFAGLVAPALGWAHARRANTRGGSARNIAAHYDLGNDAFALFLDETMTYSCGIFERADATLADASRAKLERLCRKLRLSAADHLLEIGTGWGSMALHAASRFGCRVTTTTISKEQHELATARVKHAGLEDRVTILLEDYRDLRGSFDKLVSVEMIEAVGHEFLPDYFKACCERLKSNGLMALQAITIADHSYEQHRKSVDFIKRHVFPGSNIPSLTAMATAAARATDFRMLHVEDIGPHYARTLAEWRRRFVAAGAEFERMGWSLESRRGWEFYFAYCEAGFAERYLGDLQILLARPSFRGQSLLGAFD